MSTVTTTQLSHESIDLRDVRNEFPLETERQNQSDGPTVSKARQATTTFQLSGLNFLSSAVNGIILVSLPTLVAELNLPEQLHVWPISVYGLAVGSTILPVGSLADAAGSRIVDLVGCFSMALLLLASGFVKSGEQLVAYRALQGVAMSMHLASSVSLVTQSIPKGRARNVAFSCLGLSQPLGFSVGLVLGGVLVDTVGWRVGFYLTGGLSLLLSFVGLWALPKSRDRRTASEVVHELKRKMDWIGSLLASGFMVCLSYFLA
ncbi:putative MFS-type transporter [Colletotrichum siamense]|nr:putative MFS-type transporter [Colletotrichum siamense]